MNCPFTKDAAAYVLGSLSPTERLDFERQLSGCEECTRAVRELAGIPGLLGRVEPDVLDPAPVERPVPDTLLPTLSREVRNARRRRSAVVAGAAAAAVAVLVPVSVSLVGDDPVSRPDAAPTSSEPAVEAEDMFPVGQVPVEASLTMEPVTWGTRLGLTCRYDRDSTGRNLPPEMHYTVVVRTRDGYTEEVGSWRSVSGKTMEIMTATSTPREDIYAVQVRAPNGRVVLELEHH
jgi:Putative zinc-finger